LLLQIPILHYADQNPADRKFPGGFYFPKTMQDQIDIKEYVKVKSNAMMIFPASTNPREGWAEQFRLAAENESPGEDENLRDEIPNSSDDSEWTW
jgi:antitoxin MazE